MKDIQLKDELKNLREAEEFISDLKSYKAERFFKSLAGRYVSTQGTLYRDEQPSEEPDEFSMLRLDAKMKAAIGREQARAKRGKMFGFRGAAAAAFIAACFIGAYFLVDSENLRDFFNDGANDTYVAGAYEVVEYAAVESHGDIEPFTPDEEEAAAPPDVQQRNGIGCPAPPLNPREFRFGGLDELPEGWRLVGSSIAATSSIFHLESAAGDTVHAVLGEPVYEPEQGNFREIKIGEAPAYLLAEATHSIVFFDFEGLQMVLTAGPDYSDLLELAELLIQ